MLYKKIISAWLNDSKNGDGKYLSVKNVSDEAVTIEPGQSLFLNMTPKEMREKNPNIPVFSKSVKIEDEPPAEQDASGEKIADEIPF